MPDKPRTFEALSRKKPLKLQPRSEKDEVIESQVFSLPKMHEFQIPRELILRLIGHLKQE